jgi:phenylpropionate dioxygenase-like ring-hydroxylating dioxygenase large terminal subunit
VQYTGAGYNFFVIKDRKNTIRAFHNVCRHRAYPVMESESGTASIIACKYHGELRNNTKCDRANISRMVLRPGW